MLHCQGIRRPGDVAGSGLRVRVGAQDQHQFVPVSMHPVRRMTLPPGVHVRADAWALPALADVIAYAARRSRRTGVAVWPMLTRSVGNGGRATTPRGRTARCIDGHTPSKHVLYYQQARSLTY